MLKTLYNTRTGSYVLKVITRPGFSRKCAGLLDSRYSKLYIKRFIKRNDIDMSEYMPARYRSFNDFFIRMNFLHFMPHTHINTKALPKTFRGLQ